MLFINNVTKKKKKYLTDYLIIKKKHSACISILIIYKNTSLKDRLLVKRCGIGNLKGITPFKFPIKKHPVLTLYIDFRNNFNSRN